MSQVKTAAKKAVNSGEKKMTAKTKMIKIKLIGSPICTPEKHKVIVRSLGLKTMNRTVSKPDTAAFRGMVKKIPHLLAVVE